MAASLARKSIIFKHSKREIELIYNLQLKKIKRYCCKTGTAESDSAAQKPQQQLDKITTEATTSSTVLLWIPFSNVRI